ASIIGSEKLHALAPLSNEAPPPPPPPQSEKPESPPNDPLSRGNGRGEGNGFAAGDFSSFNHDGYPHGERDDRGRHVAEYFHRDLKGALYLKVVKRVTKSGKKSFPQYHLENGCWVKGKPNGPALPYRLPELLAAPPNATVQICEGEKDADN